jgi:GxxExxY protein
MLTRVESNLPLETEEVVSQVIGASIRVHSELGPGFLESIYATALAIELGVMGIPFERELSIVVHYRGHAIAGHRLDFVVGGAVVLEIKAAARIDPIVQATVLSYLRATKLRVGLIVNFNMPLVRDGIKRVVV